MKVPGLVVPIAIACVSAGQQASPEPPPSSDLLRYANGANDAFASLHALRPDKPEFLTIAKYFDNRNVKDPTIAGTDILDGRHANQHIPQFIGYLRVYEQNDAKEYHTAAKNFWDMVVPHRTYAHGGVGVRLGT